MGDRPNVLLRIELVPNSVRQFHFALIATRMLEWPGSTNQLSSPHVKIQRGGYVILMITWVVNKTQSIPFSYKDINSKDFEDNCLE